MSPRTELAGYLIRRQALKDRTLGRLLVYDGLNLLLDLATLEPPWQDNLPNVSCVPPGRYRMIPRSSQKFRNHLLIEGVPGRSDILIHAGNYPSDTRGCILVGTAHKDIDGDGAIDVSESRAALERLVKLIQTPTVLQIIDA